MQRVQDLQIAGSRGGMIVVDPPRTTRHGHAVVDFQTSCPGCVALPPKPSARAVIEGLDVDLARQLFPFVSALI